MAATCSRRVLLLAPIRMAQLKHTIVSLFMTFIIRFSDGRYNKYHHIIHNNPGIHLTLIRVPSSFPSEGIGDAIVVTAAASPVRIKSYSSHHGPSQITWRLLTYDLCVRSKRLARIPNSPADWSASAMSGDPSFGSRLPLELLEMDKERQRERKKERKKMRWKKWKDEKK